MNGVIVLYEILHEAKMRNQIWVILKLDFEKKTYDKVKWNFLFSCLVAQGFCAKWCKWIEQVVCGDC